MPSVWEPGKDYTTGTTVVFESATYKIVQPHRSQLDWTPSVTPALWDRVSDEGDHAEHPLHEPSSEPPTEQRSTFPPPYNGNPQCLLQQGEHDHSIKPSEWPTDVHHQSLNDKGNNNIGLAVGGQIATPFHTGDVHDLITQPKKKEDEDRERAAWVDEAKARTEQFNRNGPRSPATWVLTQGKNFQLPSAINVKDSKDQSLPLYVCRVYHNGGKQIGVASAALEKGAVFGYKYQVHHRDVYEILLGDMHGLRWVPAHGKVDITTLEYPPVEGGHEHDGTLLYIIRAVYDGAYYPGKASVNLDGAYLPIDSTEKNIKHYEVLCYNS